MEKIGYIESSKLLLSDGLIDYETIKDSLENVNYGLREAVENNRDFIQPIAIAIIVSEKENKILCVKKTKKSTDENSPEFGQTLLYVGGHMRLEDSTTNSKNFLDVLANTLERELFEELGVSIAINRQCNPYVIYDSTKEKSKKHLAIGWVIKLGEETKIRLDSYELIQKKGRSKSGTFVSFNNITDTDMSLEAWSRQILLKIFREKLSDSQIEVLAEPIPEQLSFEV